MRDSKLELFHRLLDGGLSHQEESDIRKWIEADFERKREFDELAHTVEVAASCPKLTVDALFTEEVMKRLPAPKQSLKKSVTDFLFGQRVFRWNIASVAAASIFMIIISGIFFQSGKNSAIAPGPSSKTMEKVRLAYYAPEAKTVSLAGDFNKWSADEGLMKRQADGTWSIEVPLKPGVYHYMFVVNGEGWVPDPRADSYRDDGFGNKNAVLRIDKRAI